MRIWFSGPRLFRGLVRPGISLGKEDLQRLRGRSARLPSWRKHELMRGLQSAAKRRGETMTKEDAEDAVSKDFDTGLIDANGDLNFVARGDRDQCIAQILETSAAWGQATTKAQAEELLDAALARDEEAGAGAWMMAGLCLAAGLGGAVFMASLFR